MAQQRRGEISVPPPSSSPRRVTSTGLTELLDLSPDALVVVGRAGTILLANEQAAALFGYRLQDLQEQRLEVLLPEHLHALHAAHRGHYFAAPRMRSMGSGLDLFGRRKDGTEFPVDISLRPVLLGEEPLAIGAIRDMSEQRRAEQAELLDLAHDAIFTRDLVSRVVFWNKGAEALYGYRTQQARGRISHILLKTRFPVPLSEIEA